MVNKLTKVSHLFLDLDGTLINSLPKLKHIYHDFLSNYQIKGSDQEFAFLKTSTIEKSIAYLKAKYVLNHPIHSLKVQYEAYLQKYYFKSPLFRGVKDFLKLAKTKGYQIVLTTANQRTYSEQILQSHSLDSYFDQVFTPNCFGSEQKNSEFFQNVLNTLNISSDHALVIDDSLEVIASSIEIGLNALLFSKITYHPVPCFGNWKKLSKLWPDYVYS